MDQKSPEPSVARVPDPGELPDELTGHNPKRKRVPEPEQILEPKPKRKRPAKSSKQKKEIEIEAKAKDKEKTTKKRRKQEPIKKAGTMLNFFGKKKS